MMEPRIWTRDASSPTSSANCVCATGKTPRTTSVNVSASLMAERKSVTGKLYLQGWMVVEFALARTPLAART